jgi:putative ABC transport system substrate-binding protein
MAMGWSNGRNVWIDTHWGAGDADRMRRYAAELIALAPDIILATTSLRAQSGCARLVLGLGQTQSQFSALVALSPPRASPYNDQNTRPPTRLSSFTGVHL